MLSICGFFEIMTVGMCPENDENIIYFRSTSSLPKTDYASMLISGKARSSSRNYALEQDMARAWLAERAAELLRRTQVKKKRKP